MEYKQRTRLGFAGQCFNDLKQTWLLLCLVCLLNNFALLQVFCRINYIALASIQCTYLEEEGHKGEIEDSRDESDESWDLIAK